MDKASSRCEKINYTVVKLKFNAKCLLLLCDNRFIQREVMINNISLFIFIAFKSDLSVEHFLYIRN